MKLRFTTSAEGVGEQEKTIKYRFFVAKATKQGASGRECIEQRKATMRLALEPWTLAYCEAISGVCVGIPMLSTKTYELSHTLRTLAASESVALLNFCTQITSKR